MGNRKILFIIPCKEKTYWKWQKAKGVIKEYAPWALSGATIGAAWFGYCNSLHNSYQIDKLRSQANHNADVLNETIGVVNNNAKASRQDRERIDELEKTTKSLYEQALNITEGKETPAE